MRKFPLLLLAGLVAAAELPPNQWVQVCRDAAGGRRGSAIRYAPAFLLWGFIDHDPELLQEHPLMEVPEYDMVMFDPATGRWQNHLPRERQDEWSRKLPLAYIPRTYSAITTGSERTALRSPTRDRGGVPRPDLNIVFDQAAYHPALKALVYFTGGLTAAYDPGDRRWRDLQPATSPPPVLGGSLALDPVNEELVLFGGGHVVEKDRNGNVAGYTGTWVYKEDRWRRLPDAAAPPPRMNTRLVTDTNTGVLVLFGGDGQSHYLGDTWIYDGRTRSWRESKAPAGPEPRAGHFTVYDPETQRVLIGGGYNGRDLTDMWAYDVNEDGWHRIDATVPAGFYISADIAPEKRLIVLVANTKRPGDDSSCNELYPVRTTYAFRIDRGSLATAPATTRHSPVPKRPPMPPPAPATALASLAPNRWVLLSGAAHGAPVRAWGSATFDSSRGELLYWGGGHCGYGGSDVDAFDPVSNAWRAADPAPEFPEKAWNKGVRLAGVTFRGAPWTDHGRRIYAYDPVSRRMIMMRAIRLTTGYEPDALAVYPAKRSAAADSLVGTPSSYARYATFGYDSQTGRWELLGPAPVGLDTLVTTPRGVMAVNVDWPSRLNDAGYLLPWSPSLSPADTGVYLFDAAARNWTRLDNGPPAPQNLYEMTALAYDTRRDRLLLHGGGEKRDELWAMEFTSRRWVNLQPPGASPTTSREAVYLPKDDVMLVCGPAPQRRGELAVWEYTCSRNEWRQVGVSFASATPRGASGQNRAMVYDEARDLILLVLGGDEGRAEVYGIRYTPGRQEKP